MNLLGLSQFSQSAYGTILFGALSGGVGAELSGGNFWQGAIVGGVVAGLNHVMHRTSGPGDKEKIERKKVTIKLTSEIIQDLQVKEVVFQTATGKSVLGDVSTVLDLVNAGAEIYLTHLEYRDGILTKAEYQYKTMHSSVKSTATIGAGLGVGLGVNVGRWGGLTGMAVGFSVGTMVDGVFYISAQGEKWLNRWGSYVKSQVENTIKSGR